tara:strand:+ start:45 stop:1046 length:1002 start_codon:yes stop_codon:yes gene_type:complete
MSTILTVSNISKAYKKNNIHALSKLSFECVKGEIVSVVGSSGSGKSTLLKLIAGLEIPDSGQIILNDNVVNGESIFVQPENRNCDLVFQDFSLFPNMTINDNIYFGKNAPDNKSMIGELISLTHISDILSRYPHQISGGQQQRVALVRALANKPSLLLMDEPLSHLDSALKESVRGELISILKTLEITVLIVTHDAEDALTMSDKTVVLNQGTLEQFDTPKNVYKYPNSEYAANLFGMTNIIPLELLPDSNYFFAQSSTGQDVISVRPHQIILDHGKKSTSLPEFICQVKNIYDNGRRCKIELEYKGLLLVAEIENDNLLNIGETKSFYIRLN